MIAADKNENKRGMYGGRIHVGFIFLGLAVLTLALFGPATGFDYIKLDDDVYVMENARVNTGLSFANIKWAFTTVHEDWWLPMLWISYMADADIYGHTPFGYHLTNILLHTANVLLLFWVLYRMTGARWSSAFAAALFAIHPLRVESVVWIAARKDVLSGFFWMLAMLAYVRYVESPIRGRKWLVPLFMLLGLLSKAILVILPPLLLLLDYWPLKRAGDPFDRREWGKWRLLILEKWPLILLAIIFVGINLTTHSAGYGGHVDRPIVLRLGLIPTNYWVYLGKLFWPTELAIVYPEYDVVNVAATMLALGGLLAITVTFILLRFRHPYLIVGWLWFMVALFPVIRGVRFGLAAYADRFTYLPSIGLFMLCTWVAVRACRPMRRDTVVMAAISVVVLTALFSSARFYLSFWENSETLFQRTVQLTRNNYVIYLNWAAYVKEQGDRVDEEIALLETALQIRPTSAPAHAGMALALAQKGLFEQAETHFRLAIRYLDNEWDLAIMLGEHYARRGRYQEAIPLFQFALIRMPNHAPTQYNLGVLLIKTGRPEEALPHLDQAIRLSPGHDRALFFMGNALLLLDRPDDAVKAFRSALDRVPHRVEYMSALAAALNKTGRTKEALYRMEEALARAPDSPELLNNFAFMLAATPDESARDPQRALTYARRAADLTGENVPGILSTLAVAYAANHRFEDATQTAERALRMAEEQGLTDLAERVAGRIDLFREGRAWVE